MLPPQLIILLPKNVGWAGYSRPHTYNCTHENVHACTHSSFLNSSDTFQAFFLSSHKPNTAHSFFLIVDFWFIWCPNGKPASHRKTCTLTHWLYTHTVEAMTPHISLCNYNTYKLQLPLEPDLSPSRDLCTLSSSSAAPSFTPCLSGFFPPSV